MAASFNRLQRLLPLRSSVWVCEYVRAGRGCMAWKHIHFTHKCHGCCPPGLNRVSNPLTFCLLFYVQQKANCMCWRVVCGWVCVGVCKCARVCMCGKLDIFTKLRCTLEAARSDWHSCLPIARHLHKSYLGKSGARYGAANEAHTHTNTHSHQHSHTRTKMSIKLT